MRSELFADSHPDGAGLAHIMAKPGAPTAFPIKRQQRRFIEQIVDIGRNAEAAIHLYPGAEVDELIAGQLQVKRSGRRCRSAAERQPVGEGTRIVFLISWLGKAGANMLERGS